MLPTQEQAYDEQRQKAQADADRQLTQRIAYITTALAVMQFVAICFQVGIAWKQNTIISNQNLIMSAQRDAAGTQSGYMRDGLLETRVAATAAKQSANIARDSLTSVQRAFIRFAGIENSRLTIRTESRNEASFICVAHWNNSGSTAAIPAIMWFRLKESTVEPTLEEFIGTGPWPATYVGPQATITSGQQTLPQAAFFGDTDVPSRVDDVQAIQTRVRKDLTSRVFAWGWVAYRDVFPNTPVHVTGFCVQVTAALAAAPIEGGPVTLRLTWSNAGPYNTVDNYLPGYERIAALVPPAESDQHHQAV